MKAILVVDMPKSCAECTLRTSLEANYLYCVATLPRLKIDPMTAHHIKEHKCPLKHPLKYVSNGFYIYDTKYLMENLDREIELLKGVKEFESNTCD